MANSVDLVIGSEAIKQVESLISKLSIADAELLKISQTAATASKGISGISTPSGLDKTIASTTSLNAELERQNQIIKALEIEIKKLSYSRQNNNKQTAEELVNQGILNKNAIAQAKAVSNLVGAYDKLDLAHKKAFKTAQDVGVQYGITSQQFIKASEKANKLDAELKLLDTALGKNNRNVGNYASGYNALGNSINQLTREAPAFANSVNTGFMAISNNLPILFDAIEGIKLQQKEAKKEAMSNALAQGLLAKEQAILGGATEEAASALGDQATALAMSSAEGVKGKGVLSQLAGAFFSWGTVLSLAVTLLTVYGGAILDSISGSKKRKEALEKEKKAVEEKTKAEQEARDTIGGIQSEEISKSKILFETAANLTLTYKERTKAVKELKERYPDYLSHLSNEEILAGNTAKAEEELNAALVNRGKALAAQKFLQTNLEKQLSLEIERSKLGKEEFNLQTESDKLNKTRGYNIVIANKETQILQQKNDIAKEANKEALSSVNDRLEVLRNEQQAFVDIYNENAKYLGIVKETTKETKKGAKEKREDLAQLESYIKPVSDTVNQINAQIESLKVIRITGTPEEREEAKKDIETLIELKKQLMGGSPTGGVLPDFVVPDNAPAQTKLKNDWKDTFNDIAESAQKAGDIIAGFSEMNFQNEYARLEAQKDISLKFAGDSAEAKAKIEADYEKKRIDIANRENKAKQKQAIFNIAIDTAQAIMATVGKTGFAGLPMALILGALGAAQIALVASQKIPQYFDGTDNHTGGLMLVNDGAGANFREKVILPNGKEIMPEGRNVLMNAPKGTKVLTHEQQIMEMLNERGISMSRNYQTNGGMTADEMDSVIGKHFAKIQVSQTTYDKKGFSSWIGSNGNRTIQNNNRVSRTGFRV